jgi:putative DNA primase/helicase
LETSEIESIAQSAAAYKVEADDFPLTDTGNAEFFASVAGGLVRYDHGRRAWFEFKGQHWVRDPLEHVDHLALMAIRARQTAALKISDKDTRRKRLDHALRSESRSKRDSMVQLARKIPALAVTGDDWDTESLLIGVRNGVLDLKSGRLRDGRPEDNITKVALVDYDPSARCPRWERFIKETFADNPDLASYIQRVMGYGLTGETIEQVFWILWGDGANGKSTLMECLMNSVLGQDYSWTMPFPTSGWTNAMSEYQKASLVGQRLVAASEVTHGGQLNEELIKSLTGGIRSTLVILMAGRSSSCPSR